MEKKLLIILITWCLLFAGIFTGYKIIENNKKIEVTKYDRNGNEIYHKTEDSTTYHKYNENDQILEIKFEYRDGVSNEKKTDYTYYEYDGKLLKKIIYKNDPSSKQKDHEILFEYDERGNQIKKIEPRKEATAGDNDSSKRTTFYFYDENNRLIKEISPDYVVTEYIYNEKGNLIEEKTYTPLGEGPDAPRTNESSITHEWDDKGRKTKTTYINDKYMGDRSDRREYVYDDPEIQYIFYDASINHSEIIRYMKYDWHDEYVEGGFIDINNGKILQKFTRIIKYDYWDNGNLKKKKIYEKQWSLE